ncbi:MAG: A24 family peptidase [Eubacterium sp.]|nr:A24 family peptidase [Eubacterium sp.]
MDLPVLILFLTEGAAMLDLKEERIPNGWLLTGLMLGMAEQVLLPGGRALRTDLLSVLIPFLLLFPFFLFRMIGAGDIKLLMLIGFFMKPQEVLICLFLSFAAAAGYVIFVFLRSGDSWKSCFSRRTRYLQRYMQGVLLRGERPAYWKQSMREDRLHLAVFICFAVIPWAAGCY